MKRGRIQLKLCKLCRKKKIAIKSSKYEQLLYIFFKNINFAFFSVVFFKQSTSRNRVPLTELEEICECEQCYLEKERYISLKLF